jgi:hypothetical protein
VGLLVLGDGFAGRDSGTPGYADPAALLALDPALASGLMAAGRAPWQVLASAPGRFRGEVLYDGSPYGVQYTVASWLPA